MVKSTNAICRLVSKVAVGWTRYTPVSALHSVRLQKSVRVKKKKEKKSTA